MSSFDESFARAIILKVSFHPEPLRRAQAAIIYKALEATEFTADEVLVGELTNGDTKISGICVGSLASMGLIERAISGDNPQGRCKSPSPTRNGAWVNIWRLAPGKYETAKTFLVRNKFPLPEARQLRMAL